MSQLVLGKKPAMSQLVLMTVTFVVVSGSVLVIARLFGKRQDRGEKRLKDLLGADRPAVGSDPMIQLTRKALPKIGAPLQPLDETGRSRLKTRLIHAGFYSPQALPLFLGVKMLLLVSPGVLVLAAGVLKLVPLSPMWVFAALAASTALMVAPGAWLDYRKGQRQTTLRRALPDALDVIMICLEGGLSLPGAFQRVARELRTAHPLLAAELNIVQRHIQMGRSTGEALREFGYRCDLEEARSLASVVLQSERFGAGLIKSLRVHAEALRIKRIQRAEELAQKAAIKMLLPTILLIFPAIFIVLVGPAAMQIMKMFANLKNQ
jgi:tight adherence protein C